MVLLESNLFSIARGSAAATDAVWLSAPHPGVAFDESRDGSVSGTLDGRRLCSRIDPILEAERFADSAGLVDNPCTVVVGFGLGHHLLALARKTKRSGVIVCYEPDVSLVRAAAERVDLSDLNKCGQFLLVTDEKGGELTARTFDFRAPMSIGTRLMIHPPSWSRLRDKLAGFYDELVRAVAACRTVVMSNMILSPTCIRNSLMNIGVYAGGG